MRDEAVGGGPGEPGVPGDPGDPVRRHLTAGFLRGPAERERLPLREAARDEEAVMAGIGSLPGFGRDDELHRHHVGSLVEELEEGVLGVGAGLPPYHRRGRSGGRGTVPDDALAVRLPSRAVGPRREDVRGAGRRE